MKNPQTAIAPTFLTHIIFAIDGVKSTVEILQNFVAFSEYMNFNQINIIFF